MSHFIDTILEPALWFAADWSLRWAALLTVVALIMCFFQPRRATIRELVLKAALLAGLLIPLAPHWGNGWNWPRLPKASTLSRSAVPSQSAPSSLSAPPSLPSSAWQRSSGSSASPPVSDRAAKQSLATVRAQAGLGNEGEVQSEWLTSRRLIVLGLVSCWGLIVAWKAMLRFGAGFFLRRLRRESVEATGATADLFVACRAEMVVHRTVRLATHPHVRSPILLGWRRPQIIVPPDWSQSSFESQRAGLLHELAHVRRGDHLLAPLLEIVRIAFFFHPLVRWLLARLERERELLCDEMVVRLGIDRRAYARLLLEYARSSGRLSWLAVSLPMSQRRTVKGRICHLLEEDMERWIRPLPARWAVTLIVGLLALSLGLASYRVWAEETEKTAPPANKPEKQPAPKKPAESAIKREDLRYTDKDFYQWQRELLTELKPSIRADGMRAFAAFGVNGYGPEATKAILELMRGYNPYIATSGDEDAPVVAAAFSAIGKIGATSLPTLTAAVQEDNRNVRRFAMMALSDFGDAAQPALPVLLRAFKSTDPETRAEAIGAVGRIAPKNKEVLAALIEKLNDPDATVRIAAIGSLSMFEKSAKPAIPELLKALTDKEAYVRNAAINAFQQIGGDAKAVWTIAALLQDEETFVRDNAYKYVSQLKREDAKEAVPALLAVLKGPNLDVRVMDLLGGIGPAAKDAIPALNELLRSPEPSVSTRARDALRAIRADKSQVR